MIILGILFYDMVYMMVYMMVYWGGIPKVPKIAVGFLNRTY